MCTIEYSHRLEKLFQSKNPSVPLDSDSFSIRPDSALREGLNFLVLSGSITQSEANYIDIDTFHFEDMTLQQYLNNENGKQNIERLIEELRTVLNIGHSEED